MVSDSRRAGTGRGRDTVRRWDHHLSLFLIGKKDSGYRCWAKLIGMDYRHRLSWSPSTAPPATLPEGIRREFLSSPGGALEVLTSTRLWEEGIEVAEGPPLLFIHGVGFSLIFLSLFPQAQFGVSWLSPSYLRL